MKGSAEALRYAVRFRVLARYIGQLCWIIAALEVPPLLVCLLYGDFWMAASYMAAVAGLCGLAMVTRRLGRVPHIQTNEAIVLTAASFLIAPLVSIGAFIIAGLTPVEAVFETVSGVTTTGLTMIPDVQTVSGSVLFARAWMQWYGGLGIVVFSLVLIMEPGTAAKDMADTGDTKDDLLGGVMAFARRALKIYLAMTAAAAVLLVIFGLNPFQAALYALAAVSTGGFAPQNGSAAALPSWQLQMILILVCISGSIPMLFYIRLWYRKSGSGKYTRIQALAILVSAGLVGGILILDRLLTHPGDVWGKVFSLIWMAFSAQTTTGFSTLPVAELGQASKVALMIAMFIGGGMGSTAGGIKVLRLMAVYRLTKLMICRTQIVPHAVLPIRFRNRRLGSDEIQKYLLMPLLFAAAAGVSWLLFVLYGNPALDSLFDVVSATGTVGLSSGVTTTRLPDVLKLVLCANMLLGRLEIFAWLVVLSPNTWIGRRI